MIGFTYTQLLQAMQDWPQNVGANYIGNIPRFVELGELRLVRDLNLELFDVTDSSFTLDTGTNVITKPANLISLRTMQLALITGTTNVAASATRIGLSQATFASATSITFNGALGAAPCTIPVPAQFTVTDTTGGGTGGGVIVTVTGLDYLGDGQTETINSVNAQTVSGVTRWSLISAVTTQDGSTPQTLSFGTAAVAQNSLGNRTPVYKRNYDFVTNYSSTAGVTARPRYYAEQDLNTWIVSQYADQNYAVVVRFIKRPQTIVTAGTTWLGSYCGELLLLCSLMEAEMYLKADDRFADLEGDYQYKLGVARLEMRNIIRQGDYSPYKPAATPSQGS